VPPIRHVVEEVGLPCAQDLKPFKGFPCHKRILAHRPTCSSSITTPIHPSITIIIIINNTEIILNTVTQQKRISWKKIKKEKKELKISVCQPASKSTWKCGVVQHLGSIYTEAPRGTIVLHLNSHKEPGNSIVVNSELWSVPFPRAITRLTDDNDDDDDDDSPSWAELCNNLSISIHELAQFEL
jgi:hypothetical protein